MTEGRLEHYCRQLALVADLGEGRLLAAARSAARVDHLVGLAMIELDVAGRARLIELLIGEMGVDG